MKFGYVGDAGVPVVTDTVLQGGIMAFFYLGTLAGFLFGGYVGDKYGRINTIGLGAAWGIFGAALQCFAMNSNWMIGARLVNSIGTGILNGIVPAWASELSDYTTRRTFIAMEFTLNISSCATAMNTTLVLHSRGTGINGLNNFIYFRTKTVLYENLSWIVIVVGIGDRRWRSNSGDLGCR